jgi:CheY-like chemotaxis protein
MSLPPVQARPGDLAGGREGPPAGTALPAKLLLVDDEPRFLRSLAELLDARGHQTTACADVRSAMAQLDQQRFDLVLLDLRLPTWAGTP